MFDSQYDTPYPRNRQNKQTLWTSLFIAFLAVSGVGTVFFQQALSSSQDVRQQASTAKVGENIAESDLVFCTDDVQFCSDGSYVSRDPALNCAFKPCPDGSKPNPLPDVFVPEPTNNPTAEPSISPSPFPTSTPHINMSCRADIDRNGKVDLLDYSVLLKNFLRKAPANPNADINEDGTVDVLDYSELVRSLFTSCPTS